MTRLFWKQMFVFTLVHVCLGGFAYSGAKKHKTGETRGEKVINQQKCENAIKTQLDAMSANLKRQEDLKSQNAASKQKARTMSPAQKHALAGQILSRKTQIEKLKNSFSTLSKLCNKLNLECGDGDFMRCAKLTSDPGDELLEELAGQDMSPRNEQLRDPAASVNTRKSPPNRPRAPVAGQGTGPSAGTQSGSAQ